MPARQTRLAGTGRATRRHRLLLVEDDALIRAVVADAAERAGFETAAAGNAHDALELAASGRFDLAVLDYSLPDGTGLDVAVALRTRFELPFLFLSAFADDQLVRKATELGALGYLVKPIDPGSLGPMLRTACARGADRRKTKLLVAKTRTAAARKASKRERQQLAAELHDGLGQELTGLSLLAAVIERNMQRTGHSAATDMARLRELLQQSQEHCRVLSHQQYSSAVAGSELGQALRHLVDREGVLAGIDCSYRGPLQTARGVSDTVSHHLYRVAQEALSNAVRHSGGTRIRVTLEVRADRIVLSVRDNGRGMGAARSGVARGIGCRTMSQRAKALGGQLTLADAEPSGTEVLLTVPLARRRRERREGREARSA